VKLREIVVYEVATRLRSPSTWAYALILFLVAMWMFMGTFDDGGAFANAPERIAGGSVLAGMFGMLVTAALFGGAATRDVAHGTAPLLYTAPISRTQYLGGRFLGALTVNALLLVAIPLGTLAGTALSGHWDPASVGPYRPAAWLQAYFLFLLPNLLLVGAVLFAIGALTRQMVPVYLGAIGVFIGYVVALNYAERIDSALVAGLIDPFGLVTLQATTEYWTESERNTRLIGLPATLAWNRALWLAVAAGVLAVLHGAFRFAHPDGGRGRRRRRRVVAAPEGERLRAVEVPRAAGTFGPWTAARQTLAVAGNALREVAASRWFALVLLACVGLPMLWGWNVGSTVFDTSTWPVTLLIVETVLSRRSVVLFMVLVLLYAGELVWKARENGAAEILDAAPVPTAVQLLGRFLALAALILAFQAAALLGGLLIQALQGYHHFELGLYLRVVFGLKLVDYLLLGALAMAIHVLVDHKNLGHMVTLLAVGFTLLLGPLLGIRHHLLLYGTAPGWSYSDMNGFGPFAEPLVWFRLYWLAWAALLLVVAMLLWVRGREPGLRHRLRSARRRLQGPLLRAAGVAAALILVLGGFVFYNTNVLNDYAPPAEAGAVQAMYEKRYARYLDLAHPIITHAELRVDLRPHEGAVAIDGTYRLVNRSGAPIDSLHVYLDPRMRGRSISPDRAAAEVLVDPEVGYRILRLERPLRPGESMRLRFDVALRRRGFRNDDIGTDLVGNGTYVNRTLMPFIGYQPLFELTGEDERDRFGLPPRPGLPPAEEAAAIEHRWAFRDADLVQVDAVIGTAPDQIAVTSGELLRSWTGNGRRWFHYRSKEPIAFGASIASARYDVVEDRWNDVALRILHHPAHDGNLDRIRRSMHASLDHLTQRFGAYPYDHLRIVEVPRYGGFGAAHPGMITFTEDFFFSRVREGEVDQPFYGVAHEIAHTWWGGLLRGAPVRGAALLSESLANYSAMAITEATYGAEAGRRVYEFQMRRYLRGRATQAGEVPLLEVEGQPYLAYRKGALALWTLREHIGADAVDAALRRFLDRFRDGEPPFPTSLDLYAELRAATPDSLRPMLADWFERITLWDLRTDRATAERTGSGTWLVTLDVVARKLTADEGGVETETPMDDLVRIGVYAAGQNGERGEPLHLARHRIRSGAQTIRVEVSRRPARAGIDPHGVLIERDRADNLVEVEALP